MASCIKSTMSGGMSPLFAIFPAALVALFQEELLVRVDAVVHETGQLVLDFLELVIRDRLRDGGEAAARWWCRVRQPCVLASQVLDDVRAAGHVFIMLVWRRWRCFLRLAEEVSE